MLFNVNEYVKVKLTDHGKKILRYQWDELMFPDKVEYTPPPTDDDGWSKFQLWCLMKHFGEHMYMGGEMPFETEIEIVEE